MDDTPDSRGKSEKDDPPFRANFKSRSRSYTGRCVVSLCMRLFRGTAQSLNELRVALEREMTWELGLDHA